MSYELNAIFSLSIGLGAVIGWVRFSKTDPAFFPFLLLLTIGFVNEIASIVQIENGNSNIVNYNVFGLVESVLLTWQFLKWGLFTKSKGFYWFIQVVFGGFWVAENFIRSFSAFDSYFTIVHSFLFVMMSISMINRVVLKETRPLLKHPVFLICTGLIVYFNYAVLVEAFWIFGLNRSRSFRLGIYEILAYINLITNLIFAFAFLWIPTRLRYILQS